MSEDLNKMSVEDLGKLFPVYLTDYNPEWKTFFLREKNLIKDSLSNTKTDRIYHIGSTAIPGLKSKPTIDILVEIKYNSDIENIIQQLKLIEYDSIPKPESPPPYLMFAKGYATTGYTGQTYHLHLRFPGEHDEVLFRDYLIRNLAVAEQYARLKIKLSVEFKNDREKYTLNKTEFIGDIIKRAREELKK